MAENYAYPFDPTGQASTNRIVDEQIIITSPGDRLFHFTLPKFCPFFQEGAEVKLRTLDGTVIPLTLNVDYYFSHKFMEASLGTMHPVWGSITFLRRDIVGTLLFTYQTLGGEWTVPYADILQVMANTILNPRTTTWEQVVERPREFPVIDHPWNLVDMVGMSAVVDVLERFLAAYIANMSGGGGGGPELYNHINNFLNPHRVTAAQTGAYSKTELDAILTGYRKTTDVVDNANKLAGQTLGQVLASAAAQTVDNSTRFNNYTFSQAALEILKGTAANSLKLEGRSTQELATFILEGTAANAMKLDGYTLQEVLDQVAGSVGDATTLQGKSYLDIMNDVKATKVDNATNADTFEGRTTAQLVTYLTANLNPDKAKDSDKVFGQDQNGLIQLMQTSLNFEAGQAITGVFTDAPAEFPVDVNVFIPLLNQDLDATSFGSLYQLIVHQESGPKTATIRIGFAPSTKKPIIEVLNGDIAEADIAFGYTDVGSGASREIQGWLRLKNNFNAVTLNCFNEFSPMEFNDLADWQTAAPAGVTWGTYGASGDLAQTQVAFDDLGDYLTALTETPAVP